MPKPFRMFEKDPEEMERLRLASIFADEREEEHSLWNSTPKLIGCESWNVKVDRQHVLNPPVFRDPLKVCITKERARKLQPPNIDELNREIARSRRILIWPDNWDGEGSPRYAEETWIRAVNFLRSQIQWAFEHLGRTMPVPRIQPGPYGSIDLHWKMNDCELLINIPSDPEALATYYGDDLGKISIRGSFAQKGDSPLPWFFSRNRL